MPEAPGSGISAQARTAAQAAVYALTTSLIAEMLASNEDPADNVLWKVRKAEALRALDRELEPLRISASARG